MTLPLDVIARRLADQQTARVADAAAGGQHLAQVIAVQIGAARGGTDLVTVRWRGADFIAHYLAQYTPVVNDWVLFTFVTSQPVLLGRVVGQP